MPSQIPDNAFRLAIISPKDEQKMKTPSLKSGMASSITPGYVKLQAFEFRLSLLKERVNTFPEIIGEDMLGRCSHFQS